MEAVALGRGRPWAVARAACGALRSRSRVFWALGALAALAALLRFATLGQQSYHHDEVITAGRILGGSFWHAMEAVGSSESAPPLYYALAWGWTQLTGTAEIGLRSISALAGVASVPVAYLIAERLRGRRAGLIAAALVAVNPMLLWYSQEARAYALFALLCALSLLFFVRALGGTRRGDVLAWGAFSALALATHYFALFGVAAEAAWLLRRRGRASLPGIGIIALSGLLLAPLALQQMSIGHAQWIGNYPLPHRLWEAAQTFMVGETAEIIGQPEHPLLAALPLLAVISGLLLLRFRGDRGERRAGGVVLLIAAATVLLPVALALVSPGRDYILARNLLPALIPILIAVAIATSARRAGRLGAVIATALIVYSLGFCVWVDLTPALQRPDWRAVAAQLGRPQAPRAVVTWILGVAPLRYYLSNGSFEVSTGAGFEWLVHEVDFVSNAASGPALGRLLGPGFKALPSEAVGRLQLSRYVLNGPGLRPLRMRSVRKAALDFPTNGVLIDGVGPR